MYAEHVISLRHTCVMRIDDIGATENAGVEKSTVVF